MKKTILLALLMLTLLVQAQRSRVELDVAGRFGYSSMYKSSIKQGGPAAAPGIGVQINARKVFGFRVEVCYERKGGQSEINFTDEYGNVIDKGLIRYQYDYITLPLLFRFEFGKRFRPYLEVGGFGSYNFRAQIKQPSATNYHKDTTVVTTSYVKRFDAGLALGIGFNVMVTNQISIAVGFRDHLSLVNNINHRAFTGPVLPGPKAESFHNSALFTFGLTFHLAPFNNKVAKAHEAHKEAVKKRHGK